MGLPESPCAHTHTHTNTHTHTHTQTEGELALISAALSHIPFFLFFSLTLPLSLSPPLLLQKNRTSWKGYHGNSSSGRDAGCDSRFPLYHHRSECESVCACMCVCLYVCVCLFNVCVYFSD